MQFAGVLMVVAAAPALLLACGAERSPHGGSAVAAAAPTAATAAQPDARDEPAPPPTAEVPPTSTVAPIATPSAPPAAAETVEPARSRECRCGILDFESNGPAKGRCTWDEAADGTVQLTGESAPKFSAKVAPSARASGARRGYEGTFDFACKQRWCGRRELPMHPAGEGEYRVTVERSDEGPPSLMLWVTCKP